MAALFSLFSGSISLTGSLSVFGGITGSLFGTASYAMTTSRADSASYAPVFPYTGSAVITGTLEITNDAADTFFLIKTGSFNAFKVTGSGVAVLGAFVDTPAAVEGGIFYSASGEYFLGN